MSQPSIYTRADYIALAIPMTLLSLYFFIKTWRILSFFFFTFFAAITIAIIGILISVIYVAHAAPENSYFRTTLDNYWILKPIQSITSKFFDYITPPKI